MSDHMELENKPIILSTRLTLPALREGIVRRQRLLDKVNGAPRKLILVAAPAGFGKSTLVVDWLRDCDHKHAWLSLDERDNDPALFLRYLVSAFQSLESSIGKKIIPLLSATTQPPWEPLLSLLLNDLNTFRQDVYVVLDDFHFIEDQQIHSAVAFLLDHLPSHVHLIIATRVDPSLPLARMRVRNELIEIRERDLRFTKEEAESFFRQTMHVDLSADNIDVLETRTEGWIAALQMAAISLLESSDVQKFVNSFAGSNRYVAEYLLEEVLSHQPESIQKFLLQTCILSRFNAEICQAVTQQPDARRTLDVLERANLFLIPLDDKREWFRYHQLFSELLSFRLRHLYPQQLDELNLRASMWLEKQGNVDQAIQHALRIADRQRAIRLLDQHSLMLIARRGFSDFRNWTKGIELEQMQGYPMLLISNAWLQLVHRSGDLQRNLESIERSLAAPAFTYTGEQMQTAKAIVQAIRAFMQRLEGKQQECIDACHQALQLLPSEQGIVRGVLYFIKARAFLRMG